MKFVKNTNWSELSHAYGTADDIPELLQMLKSKTKNDREEAIRELFGNIYHQGTIYEATGYTIPFLLELIFDSGTKDKNNILGLIASITYGTYRKIPNIKVEDELKKEKIKFYNFIHSEDLECKIFSIQILAKIENENEKLIELIKTEYRKSTDYETKIHLILGLYLITNGKINLEESKEEFNRAKDNNLKTTLASLIVNSFPDKNNVKEIIHLLNEYLNEDRILINILSYWSIADLNVFEEEVLLKLEYEILNQYYHDIKVKEKEIRNSTDEGDRMYKMTDFLCLLIKSVFKKKFKIRLDSNCNKDQDEVINKVYKFYTTTENELYNSWLKGEKYSLYDFLERNFEIDFLFNELIDIFEEK